MTSKLDPRWWDLNTDAGEDETIAWKRVMSIVRSLDEDLKDEKDRMARCARLYDPLTEFVGTEVELRVGPYPSPVDKGPVVFNIVKSAVDTVTSMVAKDRPRAAFMTDGADWTTAMKAEDLEKVVEGEFQRCEVYDDAVRAFRDGTAAGLGAVKVFAEDGEVNVERINWDTLVWDRLACKAGPPIQMHELRFVDKDLLKKEYPDHADEIELASATDSIRRWTSYRQVDSELIPVVESWKIGDDGIHAICMDGATLLWEEYTENYLPFVFFRYSERLNGFAGASLSEELAGIQNRINKIVWHISRCHDLSNTYVLVQAVDASLRIKATGGNQPLQLLPYRGQIPPKFEVPQAVPPELYEHLQYLIRMAYQISGISELSATSQKPAGLESAVALQTFSDIETQRFSIVAQRYEKFILDIARMIIKVIKQIMKDKGEEDTEPSTVWNSHNAMRRIKWKDVDIDDDLYSISIQASSLLSRTPAGRIQAAVELGNANLFDRDELRRLIGHPDLERTLTMEDAAQDHAERVVERLKRGEYRAPEILDNLPVCMKVVQNYYLTILDRDAPEDILDLFRQWLTQAQRRLTDLANAQAPPPQQGQPPGAAPPGGPSPAPPMPPKPPALELPPQAAA